MDIVTQTDGIEACNSQNELEELFAYFHNVYRLVGTSAGHIQLMFSEYSERVPHQTVMFGATSKVHRNPQPNNSVGFDGLPVAIGLISIDHQVWHA